jgi:hypothetical protein
MVEIEDYIKLRSLVFQHHFADQQEWNDGYLWEGLFQHVCLWFSGLKTRGESAKMIFDSACSKVIEIEYDNNKNPLFITTELFWIIFPDALDAKEIEIIKPQSMTLKEYKEDTRTIKDLEFFESEYLKGIFDILERENNKKDTYKRGYYMMRRESKWSN